MFKKVLFSIFILTLVFSLSGCISFEKEEAVANPGGIFISGDKGDNWTQKIDLMTAGAATGTIGEVNVVKIVFDPNDSSAMYIGTAENGLYYSYNSGKGWFSAPDISSGFVRSIAIDPKNRCTIYAAVNTRLMKSMTCSRTWEESFKVPVGQLVTAVAVDYYNPQILYIGLDSGEFYKSLDQGVNWERIKKFPSRINLILLDKDNSRHLYVGTDKSYLYRSTDAGENWESLKDQISVYKDSKRTIELIQDQQGTLYYATGYGMLRSEDKGNTWQEVKLLTTPTKTNIYSMAINPNNRNEIYYATNTNFYRSIDRGQTWNTSRLPTTRYGRALIIHPEDGNIVYLGVREYQ